MKTLKSHMILYDADCPMCKGYTNLFVKTGMLDAAGRHPYQQIPSDICPYIDRQRAVNEIALVNKETGEVSYGINSIFKVLGNAFPMFRGLFNLKPFIWLMTKVYAFISYNRKVIIPAHVQNETPGSIQPTFRLDYRIAYLLFTVFISSYILSLYAGLFVTFVPKGHEYREYFVCAGQVLFQGIIVSLIHRQRVWIYLGNMMTISFAGALLLTPMLLVSTVIELPELIYVLYFLFVAGLMLLEHTRRSQLLQLGWTLTCSWVLYRIIVLFIIFKLSSSEI